MTKALLSALVLIFATDSAVAQVNEPSFEGRTILGVQVSGLNRIKESVVVSQIASAPGQPYHKATADRDVVRLERLGVFAGIALTPVAVGDGVWVNVTVTETPRIAAGLDVAITDQNGASIGPALKVTSFAGHPVDVGATAHFGGETVVSVDETAPQLTNRRLWHSASVSLSDRVNELEHFRERSVDADARMGVQPSERWRAGAIFKLYGLRADVSGITLSPDNHDSFESIGVVVEYDNRDSFREPSRGWLNSIDALWTTGSGQYATLDADARRYQPVGRRQVIVATALVTMQSGRDGVDLPAYADHALGGENTVRGWGFASRRGKNQLISTVEYRYTAVPTRSFRVFGANLYAGLALAGFVDVGSAWNHSDEFSDGLIGGAGIGLRVYIPYVSMLRLDLSVGNGVLGGFGIDEKAAAQRSRVR
jgi:outer membrane protein assembly factor BamA